MSPTQQPDPKPDRRDPGAPGRPGDRPDRPERPGVHPDQELPEEPAAPKPTPPPTTN